MNSPSLTAEDVGRKTLPLLSLIPLLGYSAYRFYSAHLDTDLNDFIPSIVKQIADLTCVFTNDGDLTRLGMPQPLISLTRVMNLGIYFTAILALFFAFCILKKHDFLVASAPGLRLTGYILYLVITAFRSPKPAAGYHSALEYTVDGTGAYLIRETLWRAGALYCLIVVGASIVGILRPVFWDVFTE